MLAPFNEAHPLIQGSPVHTSFSIRQDRLLNTLGLKGLDAITYLHRSQQRSSRPTIELLLSKLPVKGMNT